jgi:hypothetical protein
MMIEWQDFRDTSSIQAVAFTPGFSFTTGAVLKIVLDLRPDFFGGQPTVLPLPEDAPRHVPRIILQSGDRKYRLEVAPERVNFFRLKTAEDDHPSCAEFMGLASGFLSDYAAITRTRCGRLASVFSRFCVVENPALVIARHYCKEPFLDAPFDRPGAFELHAHKKYVFRGFDVNSWMRIKSGRVRPAKAVSVIFAEQDINTLAEVMQDVEYTKEQISTFFGGLCREFDAILQLYFPIGRVLESEEDQDE